MDDIRMKYPIVMIVGKLGSGKDTIAAMFRDRVNNGDSVTLASPMKDFAIKVFGFTKDQMYGASILRMANFSDSETSVIYRFEKEKLPFLESLGLKDRPTDSAIDKWFYGIIANGNKTGRHILQTLGTEFGRSQGRDIWINAGLRSATEKLVNGANLVTITDGRFRNEVLAVKAIGGMVVNIFDPADKSVATHPSEKEQESIPPYWYDYTITNDKTLGLEHLRGLVDRIKL